VKNKLILMIAIALLATAAGAQDWQSGSMGNVEYNCEAIMGAIGEVGALYYVILGTDDLTPGDGDAEHYVLSDVTVATVAESLLARAPGCGTAHVLDDDVIDIYEPDAWKPNITRDYMYQCDVVRAIVAAYGHLDFRREGDRHHTVIGFYQEDAPDCVPRYVIATRLVPILECADHSCKRSSRLRRGQALPVVGLSDGWYEVAFDNETGFVSEDLVEPGPLAILQEDEQFSLQYADCLLVQQRRERDYRYVAVLKAGPAYKDMEVALYMPLSDAALEIYEENEGEFSNNGQPYILQMPPPELAYPTGIYTIELTLGDLIFRYGFEATEKGLHYIHVYCN
jgi:hypothetical protein